MRTSLSALLAACSLTIAFPASAAVVDGQPGLLEAVRDDVAPEVGRLLRSHADVNVRDELGATPLAWAVLRNNAGVVQQLLAAGADPNLTDLNGVGPLALAVESASPQVVRMLLDKGADPNLARSGGETPLMTAARIGSAEIARLILAHGGQVNVREKRFGQTALMWATGHPEIVRMLLDKGADVTPVSKSWDVTSTIYTPITSTIGVTGIPWNHAGDYTIKSGGLSALLFAIQKRDLDSAKMLLAAGADVNQAAADGTTPLLAALFKWNLNGRRTQIGTGAVVGSPDLAYAADLPMARLLLDKGAKVTVANATGYTPLHGAVLSLVLSQPDGSSSLGFNGGKRSDPERARPTPPKDAAETLALVKRLLDAGADPNAATLYPTQGPVNAVRIDTTPPGSTPFHLAAATHSPELVAMMAAHGGDPNRVRKDGHSPLSVAVMTNDLPVVQEMVSHGGNVRQLFDTTDEIADPVQPRTQQRQRQTLLHFAGVAGSEWVVDYLVEKGAPLNARNSLGETPYDLADAQERFRYARLMEGRAGVDGPKVATRETQTSAALQRLSKGRMARSGSTKPEDNKS